MPIESRPDILHGQTYKVDVACGRLYITLNRFPEGKLAEVFLSMGNVGGCAAAQLQAIGKLASAGLRSGLVPMDVVHYLKNIQCYGGGYSDGKAISSCADAIAQAIEEDEANHAKK